MARSLGHAHGVNSPKSARYFFVKCILAPPDNFDVRNYVSFVDGPTRAGSCGLLAHTCTYSRTSTGPHFYFNHIVRLWNSASPIDLDSSYRVIIRFFWLDPSLTRTESLLFMLLILSYLVCSYLFNLFKTILFNYTATPARGVSLSSRQYMYHFHLPSSLLYFEK